VTWLTAAIVLPVITMKELWALGNKKTSRLKARKKIGDTSIQQFAL
jgi:hypothetical protein